MTNKLRYCNRCFTIYMDDGKVENFCGCKSRSTTFDEWYEYFFNKDLEFNYEEARRDLAQLVDNLRKQEKEARA